MDEQSRIARLRSANRARERHIARQKRQPAVAVDGADAMDYASLLDNSASHEQRPRLRSVSWLFSSRQPVAKLTLLVALAILAFFVGSYLFSGRIFPNVYALGVPIGDLTPVEAAEAIRAKWSSDIVIDFTVDGELIRQASPTQIGLSIDAEAMAAGARAAGLAGIPFGIEVAPSVAIDYGRAQSLLLDMTEAIFILPYEAGYKWSGGKLVTVPGRQGRHLDISASLEQLNNHPQSAIGGRRFELPVILLLPTTMDSSPFIEEAQAFLSGGVRLRGYDPFLHQMISWQVDQSAAAEWLIAGENGLAVRQDAFSAYIQRLNRDLVSGDPARFIDELAAIDQMQDALNTNNPTVVMRVRHMPHEYYVEIKDTGYKIGRKNGLPYQLVYGANQSLDWSALSVGQQIQIPSRDVLIPENPVPHKRIIVDIETQWLVAFERNQMVFSWAISSGRETAPTYPGVYQILSHNEKAFGGSYQLCNDAGTNCDQWTMHWFMGIYEVVPGLMNGFHGAVELPNGNFLGGGGVYEPSTFGCIMSLNDQAQQLYRWAERGTIVEILSDDYAGESELARFAKDYIGTIDTNYRPNSA